MSHVTINVKVKVARS